MATDVLGRVRSFFGAQIWRDRLGELPRFHAAAYRVSRIAYSTVRGFLDNRLTVRAAALTYFTVLSVVPLLAFAFAVLKGFGAYRTFVDGTVRPYVRETFAGNPALLGAIERVLQFVERTDVSRLGTLAVVLLLYTSVTLVASVEEALNDVFGVRTKRSFLRQLTDYTTLLVTAPMLLVVATTVSAAAQSSRFVAFLREALGLGPVIDFIVGATPLLFVGLALFAIYVILPNVRIRVPSALLGAAVAALLWEGALILHVRLQLGVANYNALYSGLAAIPIFLVWTYVSWVVVLVGAQLAAAHQNEQLTRQRFHMRRTDQALKEMIGVALGAVIARDFLEGGPRRSSEALAALLEVPPQAVEEVLDDLVRSRLVAKATMGGEIAYLPGGDVDAIGADDLRQALRHHPEARELREALAHLMGPDLERALGDGEREQGRGAARVTLRELAASLAAAPLSRGPRSPAPAGAGHEPRADVEDPKRPDPRA